MTRSIHVVTVLQNMAKDEDPEPVFGTLVGHLLSLRGACGLEFKPGRLYHFEMLLAECEQKPTGETDP